MNVRVYLFFPILCCCSFLLGVQKGSEVAVSVEPFFTFPAADSDNAMLGFGWFKHGFALEDATTSCTFSSVYPVSGAVDLAGGTLYLQEDLLLQNIAQLNGLGTIIGNGHTIDFCESITYFPLNLKLVKDVNLYFHTNLDLLSTVTIQGLCRVVGDGNVLDIGLNAQIVIDSASTLMLQNQRLENVGNNNVFCVDDTGHIILGNVVICLMGDMRFTHGDILFSSHASILGDAMFWYDSELPMIIGNETIVTLDGGLNFVAGKKTPSSSDPIYFYDKKSLASCGECTLTTTGYGLNLRRGRLDILRNVIIDKPLTSTSCGLILGNGQDEAEDFEIYLGPGSSTIFRSGWLVYNNTTGEDFYAGAPSARFVRKLQSKFHMATTCTFPQCTVDFEFNGMTVPQTTLNPDAKLYYNNTRLSIPGIGDATFKARREGMYSYVLDTYDSMYFANGIFPGNIQVIGGGNQLIGNGAFSGTIYFYDSNATLTCSLDGSLQGNISLAGGTLILGNNISLIRDAYFVTTGTINIDRYLMDFGYKQVDFTVPLNWVGNNGFININSDVSLQSTWTINGICTINGYGNTLSLDNGGRIVIAPHSKLALKGLRIDVVDIADIQCVDDTGVLVLDDVSWIQHSDYVFDKGAIEFRNKVVLGGEDLTFGYASVLTSTIMRDSSLSLDHLFTFSYIPKSAEKNLIQFEDGTSMLKLNGATLALPATGMELTKGILQIRQDSTINGATAFDSEGNTINEGLTLGDGTSGNDIYVNFMGDKTLNVYGSLNYKNVQQDYLGMSMFSRFNIGVNATLRVYEDMVLGSGNILFNAGATCARSAGKQIYGSINAAGIFANTIL